MFNRALAAASAVALAAVVLTAPMETAARGGGGGHFGGFRSAMRPFHPAHPFLRHARPFGFSHSIFRHAAFLRRNHNFSNGGYPYGDWGGGAPFYGSYYDPSDTVSSIAPPFIGPAVYPAAPDAVERVGCRSQKVTVQATGGGEREITVTRC